MKYRLLFFVLSAFLILPACSGTCDCDHEMVCVTVINATGNPIEKISLLSSGAAIVAKYQLSDQTCLSFQSRGESSFYLGAILNNGETLLSKEEYSEGGYKFIATVTKDTIRVEHEKLY